MILRSKNVFVGEGELRPADVAIENGMISEVAAHGSLLGEAVDVGEALVSPGLVDIHTHGAMGSDFCDGEAAGIEKMLAFYGGQGVTSVAPATMSFNQPILTDVLQAALPYFDKVGHGAVLRGVNMEGPFINVEKKGAQNAEFIVDPQVKMFEELYELCDGHICLVDIAPELPGSLAFIDAVKDKCTISIAHTGANYDEAEAAFKAGASHVTHLFNAMPPFTHRAPGVVGAASDYAAHVEVISDGYHLHPAVVRAVFAWFGEERVCLISDSMRATGMPDGDGYDLGGQMVTLKDGKATLADGTIAGSAADLGTCLRRAVSFGVPLESALRAATSNPAEAAGLADKVGRLAPGLCADVVVWNEELQPVKIIVGGQEI